MLVSIKGVYTALSGAMAQNNRLDTIANNLANVSTPGFKRDQQLFQEYLTANEKPPEVIQVPRIPGSIESFYDMQGGDKSYVDARGTFTDFSQGSLKHTGNQLDLAVDGQGFFEVATPNGVRFTRAGNFTLDGNGQLVTKDGFPVLKASEGGDDPTQRTIVINGKGNVSITDSGEVFENGQSVGKISLVKIANLDSLQKVGNSLYDFKKNFNPEISNVENPMFKSGFVETSNVNIVQEMTDMISANRVFESTQKAISAYDSMADKLANVVGKTTA